MGIRYRWCPATALLFASLFPSLVAASSHREAPLIALDPQADNTDLYAFRSPDAPNTVTLIAAYVPSEGPNAGPNYDTFGENIRYEIHIDNNLATAGDDIIYRFVFTRVDEDPTTFFNIRLGQRNQRTRYSAERSMNGGTSFTTIVSNGNVPPNDIGPRSIENGTLGLGVVNFDALFNIAITTATTGERVYCGPADDPFFTDSGGLFDFGGAPRANNGARDGFARANTHVIALQVPIGTLQKDGQPVSAAANILDSNFVIGVWASAQRPQTRTLNLSAPGHVDSGAWQQVSRVGMPLTNTLFVPMAAKDFWNALSPHSELAELTLDGVFRNPELALYMDTDAFAAVVPAFAKLRVPRDSLHGAAPGSGFDFGNGNDGLFPLKGSPAVAGTALDDALFGNLLLPGAGLPRSVDIWPLFHLGLPNLRPYQLATGKPAGSPLAAGKPFINNFLPNGGDMLRLNMAVPVTPRNDADFSSLGLVHAMRLGLTDARFNTNVNLVAIPNMDGFPNGRRLEDDVTRITLQAASGVFLNAIGFWHDDYSAGSPLPFGPLLANIFAYSTAVEANDRPFRSTFPYLAAPWRGTEVLP